MGNIWILVADSGVAHIYMTPHMKAELEMVQSLRHEPSRLHPRELGTDVPGRVHDRFGPARHSLDPAQGIKSEERHRFARELADLLAESLRQKKFDRLVVIAAPAFLGTLRECFSKQLAQTIVAEIPKDLTAQDAAAVKAHLP